MKKNYVTILVLAMTTAIVLTTALPCGAAEKEKSIWSEDEPERKHRRFELTDEAVERIMNGLRETNPEKAEELAKLRKENPEQFKAELRKVMRARFGERRREGMGERGWRKPGPGLDKPSARPGGRGGRGERGGRDEPGGRGGRGMMRGDHGEFLKWFKENYPEQAEKLAGLKMRKPGDYDRRLGLSLRKYRIIFEAEKENPRLAKVLKKDLELKGKRVKLLRKIRTAKDDGEKKELTAQLKEVVSSRFDLLVRRKQVEYEQLLRKLEKLKEEVEKRGAEVQKWNDPKIKDDNVKMRVDELLSERKKFRWD